MPRSVCRNAGQSRRWDEYRRPGFVRRGWVGGGDGSGTGGGGTVLVLNIGATAGYALKLGESFRVLPEIALLYPVVSTATASSGGSSVGGTGIGDGLLFQFTVALLFGGN